MREECAGDGDGAVWIRFAPISLLLSLSLVLQQLQHHIYVVIRELVVVSRS